MDLESLYGGSFVNWEAVAASWNKRTVSSRVLLFAARRYLNEAPSRAPREERAATIEGLPFPEEVRRAFATPPLPPDKDPASDYWGEFVDAALVAEMEMVSYGERPPLLHELRSGLDQAAGEAGPKTPLGRWFLARREALPGEDLPEDPGYMPV